MDLLHHSTDDIYPMLNSCELSSIGQFKELFSVEGQLLQGSSKAWSGRGDHRTHVDPSYMHFRVAHLAFSSHYLRYDNRAELLPSRIQLVTETYNVT